MDIGVDPVEFESDSDVKSHKLRKLPLCSTLYGNMIISEAQVFVQGFTTLVCIMYNAKDICFSRKS